MKNYITVAMWDDVVTSASAESGEYERTDNMREIVFDSTFSGMLEAAAQFAHWVKQHIGPHERPNLDGRSRFTYTNVVIHCDDGDIDDSGEVAYRRVGIAVPETWTQRNKCALNAAIERALNKY